MECNRDEAKTAMDIAEKKIIYKDYKGAKNLATKAQRMFPELDSLEKLLVTIEVYLSGEKKISGEPDWYGVLGVDPLASDVEVRKKYLKLALMLHPDKNKVKGAQGAFNLISEAWSVLSNSGKRKLYNEKRKINGTQRTVTTTHQPTPSYRSEPVTVESTRPEPHGCKGKSSVCSSSEQKEWFETQPTTQSANPVLDQPTPSYRSEPVTVESTRPKPRGREGSPPPFVSSEQKEWFVKRILVKRSDRSVRTTP